MRGPGVSLVNISLWQKITREKSKNNAFLCIAIGFSMRLTLSSHSYIFILNTRALFLLAVQGKYINSAGEGEESGIILL